jgi:hypothetical protein
MSRAGGEAGLRLAPATTSTAAHVGSRAEGSARGHGGGRAEGLARSQAERRVACNPRAQAGGRAGGSGRGQGEGWGPELLWRRLGAHGGGSDGERGAAVIEFVLVFLVLMVPLAYAIVVMADVQRALLTVSTAAREVGRVYVTASTAEEARRRTSIAYREVLENFGYAPGDPRARLSVRAQCTGRTAGCVAGIGPGAEVLVRVTYRVPVARLPFIGAIAGPDLPIGATHHTRVDRYRGIGP